MYRKWKKAAVLGLAVLIGGMMPMGTMLAAEDNTEVAREIETEATGEEVQENTDAPVIDITLNGESCKVDGLGGAISYKYTNVSYSKFGLSASLNNTPILFCYYLDDNPGDEAKDNDNISWSGKCSSMDWGLSSNKAYVLYMKAEANGQTVYARSCGVVVDTTAPEIVGVEEGKTYPAGTTFTVSDANLDVVMVNETLATPEPDGSYRVSANGTSCVIRAKDKAGNEKICSITVSGGEEPGTGEEKPGTGEEEPGTGEEKPGAGEEKPGAGEEKPGTGEEKPGAGEEKPGTGEEKPGAGDETPETDNIISESGVYTLKAGVKYHLAEGKWKVDGDKSVYQGDRDFYVKSDGDYKFKK